MHVKFSGEAEWLALREQHIGGSEVAALFNVWRRPDGSEVVRHLYELAEDDEICLGSLSPYTTGYRLYMEKTGKIVPEDLSQVGRIMAGVYLEPAIAAWANRRWPDWKLKKARVYHQHPEVKGWGASLDYFEGSGATVKVAIDVKNVDGYEFKQKWSVDDETGEIFNFPLHIVLQLQHQIGATGCDKAGVLACVGGNELRRGFMAKHEPTQQRIREAIQAFWAGVAAGVPPPEADYGSVAEVYAFGDADGEELNLGDNAKACRDVRRLQRWAAHAKFVEGQLELLKGRVASYMGTSTKARFDGLKVSWPVTTRPAKQVSYFVDEKTYRMGLRISAIKEPKKKAA